MQTIVDLVMPDPEAQWVVFYSLGKGADKGVYYDAHPIEHMSHHLTMLAYDMNDAPLSFGSRRAATAPQRIELGFKQVKRIKGIEFVAHYSEIGSGYAAITKTTNSSATDNPSSPAYDHRHRSTLEMT